MAQASERKTANEPVEGMDPGGTHSTRPGQADKQGPATGKPKADQHVESGDRNDRPPERC